LKLFACFATDEVLKLLENYTSIINMLRVATIFSLTNIVLVYLL